MSRLKSTMSVLLLSFMSSAIWAQDSTTVRDFELWTGVGVQKSFLDKKLQLALTEEFRFNDNSTRINNFFTEVEAGYEFYKNMTFSLGYRFIKNNQKNGFVTENRFYADLAYSHKIDRLKLSYRFRFQTQSEAGTRSNDVLFPSNKMRLKLKAEYNIKKWKLDPYFSMEGFYAMETDSYTYIDPYTITNKVNGFQKLRFTLGTSYKINDLMELCAFYRIERELKSYPLFYNTPATYYIGGLNLTFKL